MGGDPKIAKTRAAIRAIRLYDFSLVDTEIPKEPAAAHLLERMEVAGLRQSSDSEDRIEELWTEIDAEPLIKGLEGLCQSMMKMRSGLPTLRRDPRCYQLARVVAPDSLLLFHPQLQILEDERFDWAGVPSSDGGRIGKLLGHRSIESHIHLGGTLTPLFFWLPLMGGGLLLDALRNRSSTDRGYASDEVWQERVGHAIWLRLRLAATLERTSRGKRPFPWLKKEWIERESLGEDSSPPATPDMTRELAFDIDFLFRAEEDLEPNSGWPFPDPLRPREWLEAKPHFALGERHFLHLVARLLKRWAHSDSPETRRFEAQVEEYLQIRNAFHRLLVHDRGEAGLARFVQNFRRRGLLKPTQRSTSRRGRRQQRHRRLVAGLERSRMEAGLDSQLVEPFAPDPLPISLRSSPNTGLRQIEMRVSVPPVQTLIPTFNAWLEGLRGHIEPVQGHSRNSHVGLVFHFIKSGKGPEARKKALEAAQRLAGALQEHPWLRHFVAGIDAAGLETASNPRVFFEAFRYMQTLQDESRSLGRTSPLRLGYTFHVGEDCRDLLTGLRHMDEAISLLLPQDTGGRLGHALALGDDVSRFYRRRKNGSNPPLRSCHLLDLVWAWGRTTALGKAVWTSWIERRVLEMSGVGAPQIEECFRAMELDDDPEYRKGLAEDELMAILLGPSKSHPDLEAPCSVPWDEDVWIEIVSALQAWLRHRIARRPICVEANPTSNLLIGDYGDYSRLPYGPIIEAGIPLSINTDDPGLFMTTLPGEFAAMYGALEKEGKPHREILAWLRDRIFDAEQSTFLDRHVPGGEATRQVLEAWHRESRPGDRDSR